MKPGKDPALTTKTLPTVMNQFQEIKRDTASVVEAMAMVVDAVLPLKERGITQRQLERRVWTIWGHTRQYRNSLDSDLHCKKIMEVITDAVTDVQLRLEESVKEVAVEREKAKVLRKKLATCMKDNTALAENICRTESASARTAMELAKVKWELEELQKEAIMEAS